jgi:hypothetical protein
MDQTDAPDLWRKDFVAVLRLIGLAAARLPYGVPEPVLGGEAAIELYSGGLCPTPLIELLTTEPQWLREELQEMDFREDERTFSAMPSLRHPTLERAVSIIVRSPVDANVLAVEIGRSGRQDATTIRVIGIEDLIADQITTWLGLGGRGSETTTIIQVLVELGRAGVGGPFRPAYLQRRLARETGGEVVLEAPVALCGLDDPATRVTSLTSIASRVRNWRASRNLPIHSALLLNSGHPNNRRPSVTRDRSQNTESGGVEAMTAQIIPFRPNAQ